jgi:hypothetical protein
MTVSEVLVASTISVSLMGTVFGVMAPLQRLFATQPEYADMHQRMRAALGVMEKDLLAAAPPLMPYRSGLSGHDPDGGVFFRPDVITLVPAAWDPAATRHTYYLRDDGGAEPSRLMRYDGQESDVPLADHVTGLDFVYFDETGAALPPEILQDGPWFPDDSDVNRFDIDLLNIRRVRVTVRVEAAIPSLRSVLPVRTITLDIAPRNASRE